jgi:hypothetical protein
MRALLLAAVAASLAACSSPVIEAPASPSTCADVGGGLFYCEVPGGIRCVVAYPRERSGAALSCDFPRQLPTVNMPEAGQAYITEAGGLEWVR